MRDDAVSPPPRPQSLARTDRHRRGAHLTETIWLVHRRARREPASALRRNLWTARRQRRGQNHHHQDALRTCSSHPPETCSLRARPANCARRESGSRSATCRKNFRSTTISPSRKISISSAASTACQAEELQRKRKLGAGFFGARRQRESGYRQPAGRVEAASGIRLRDHARTWHCVSR